MISNEPFIEYEAEDDELHWQIQINKEQLHRLKAVVNALQVRMYLLFFSTLVFGIVLVIGSASHFIYDFLPIRSDYEVLAGAASIFGVFFLYESANSAVSIFTKWQRGRLLYREQAEAIDFAVYLIQNRVDGPQI